MLQATGFCCVLHVLCWLLHVALYIYSRLPHVIRHALRAYSLLQLHRQTWLPWSTLSRQETLLSRERALADAEAELKARPSLAEFNKLRSTVRVLQVGQSVSAREYPEYPM